MTDYDIEKLDEMVSDDHVYRRSQKVTDIGNNSIFDKQSSVVKLSGKQSLVLLLLSIVVAILGIFPTYLNTMSTVYSQHLYTALALTKGYLPYSDIFSTGGFLYYLLLASSYWLATPIVLFVGHTLLSYLSGYYFFRVVGQLIGKAHVAMTATLNFYILLAIFGCGGWYPIQMALPFVLIGLSLLLKYFSEETSDESFILYGILSAISILCDANTIIFWGLSTLFMFVVSVFRKEKTRGFYRLLAMVLGSILIYYSVGYLVINFQILGSYMAQAFGYQLGHLIQGNAPLWPSFAYQLALALGSGALFGLLFVLKSIKKDDGKRLVRAFISLVFLIHLVYLIFSQTWTLDGQLVLLPYGLLLASAYFDEWYDRKHQRISHDGLGAIVLGSWLRSFFYLPLFVMIWGIALPISSYMTTRDLMSERQVVSSYLVDKVKQEEFIYVWDDTTMIYLKSQLPTASQFSLPISYTSHANNKQLLEDELVQEKPIYFVVNSTLPLSPTIQDDLKKNYKRIQVTGLSQLSLYQVK